PRFLMLSGNGGASAVDIAGRILSCSLDQIMIILGACVKRTRVKLTKLQGRIGRALTGMNDLLWITPATLRSRGRESSPLHPPPPSAEAASEIDFTWLIRLPAGATASARTRCTGASARLITRPINCSRLGSLVISST